MRNESFTMEELLPLLREVIDGGGEFRLYPRGTSMMPLLREGVDSVALTAPGTPHRGDLCLYRRANGQYVLHRVVAVRGDRLSFRGDNQNETEDGVPASAVLARVSAVFRGERRIPAASFRCRCYVRLITSAPVRRWRFRKRRQ